MVLTPAGLNSFTSRVAGHHPSLVLRRRSCFHVLCRCLRRSHPKTRFEEATGWAVAAADGCPSDTSPCRQEGIASKRHPSRRHWQFRGPAAIEHHDLSGQKACSVTCQIYSKI